MLENNGNKPLNKKQKNMGVRMGNSSMINSISENRVPENSMSLAPDNSLLAISNQSRNTGLLAPMNSAHSFSNVSGFKSNVQTNHSSSSGFQGAMSYTATETDKLLFEVFDEDRPLNPIRVHVDTHLAN